MVESSKPTSLAGGPVGTNAGAAVVCRFHGASTDGILSGDVVGERGNREATPWTLGARDWHGMTDLFDPDVDYMDGSGVSGKARWSRGASANS